MLHVRILYVRVRIASPLQRFGLEVSIVLSSLEEKLTKLFVIPEGPEDSEGEGAGPARGGKAKASEEEREGKGSALCVPEVQMERGVPGVIDAAADADDVEVLRGLFDPVLAELVQAALPAFLQSEAYGQLSKDVDVYVQTDYVLMDA